MLFRKLPLGFSLGYIPKGPIGPLMPQLISALDKRCHERKAVFLKIEPDAEDNQETKSKLAENGFIQSMQTIQPQRTLLIQLEGDDDALLSQMSQKTRYNDFKF